MKTQQITYLNGKVILPDDAFQEITGATFLFDSPIETKELVEALRIIGNKKGYSVGWESTLYAKAKTVEDMKVCNCPLIKKLNKLDKIKFILLGVYIGLVISTIITYFF